MSSRRADGILERRRRRSERIVAAIALPLDLALLGYYLIALAPHDSIGDRCGAVSLVFGALATTCLVGVGPRLDITDTGLRVVNWLWIYTISWQAIRDIRVTDRLLVETVDGTIVRPTVGAGSVASRARRYRLHYGLADAILAAKAQQIAEGDKTAVSVVRRWNPMVTVIVAIYLILLIFVAVVY